VVENGLSLCKIHHAAFDQNLIGVRPDTLVIEVRPDVREDHDGPMLLHGIKEMHGVELHLPAARRAQPDRTRLEERWEEFRHAV
jgi:putative restriction endonuclease